MGNGKEYCALCLCLCLTLLSSLRTATANQDAKESLSDSIEGTIDASLVVPTGNDVKQVLLGVGDQIYDFNGTDWNLVNVSAYLYNFKGNKVGYHFFLSEADSNGGRATWETFKPFSRVTAKIISQVPQDDSIAWLLNVATSNSGNRKRFGSTTFVQRLYTIDGNPPKFPATEGEIFKSSYSALYTFSVKSADLTLN